MNPEKFNILYIVFRLPRIIYYKIKYYILYGKNKNIFTNELILKLVLNKDEVIVPLACYDFYYSRFSTSQLVQFLIFYIKDLVGQDYLEDDIVKNMTVSDLRMLLLYENHRLTLSSFLEMINGDPLLINDMYYHFILEEVLCKVKK